MFNRLIGADERLQEVTRSELHDRLRNFLSVRTVEDAFEKDVEDISWLDLTCLASDGQSSEAWELMKQVAQEDESEGTAAAKILASDESKPYRRAQFLAIRSGLIDEWQPRGGMEQQLIDVIAMSLHSYRHWLGVHIFRSTTRVQMQRDEVRSTGKRTPDFSWEMEDTERAAAMADRFLKMALRALRALRDLRRFSPSVSIQNAGQVNIGEKQVNLSGAKA